MDVKTLAKEVAAKLEDNGYIANVVTVVKNNGVEMTGIDIGAGPAIPRVYLNEAMEDVDEAYDFVISALEGARGVASEEIRNCAQIVGDYEQSKPRLRAKLVNYEFNKDIAEDFPCRVVFGDLVYYPVVLINANDELGTVKISNKIVSDWGVSANEVLDTALANTIEEAKAYSMFDMLSGAIGAGAIPLREEDLKECPMTIVTNEKKINGAAVIMNEQFMSAFGDCFVIPSSIHEMIVVPAAGADYDTLSDMINEVNRTQLRPEEVLSDHPYRFTNGQFVAA